MRDPRRLPKAHLHLEGSARPSTVRELARREGVRLPTPTKRRFDGFADFGAALSAATSVLRAPEDLARVCRGLVENEVEEGVVYTEPMVLPHLHARRFGLTPEEVFSAMSGAFEATSAATAVPLTLGAGDPLLFGSPVSGEYALCRRDLGFSDEDLALVAQSGIEASALPGQSKRRHAEGFEGWLSS